MKIIDPHVHLFDLNLGTYHWLKPHMAPFWSDKDLITRNYNENNLALSNNDKVSGFVHIEAGFDNEHPEREISWLESTVKQPFRSIAYIDITLPQKEFEKALTVLKRYKSVVGVRYILDDQAPLLLTNPDVIKNLNTLADHELLFEAQLSLTQAGVVNALAKLLSPSNSTTTPLKIIVNHAGISSSQNHSEMNVANWVNEEWLNALNCLKEYPNIAIKCSGWEIINRDYSHQNQVNIIKHCIEVLGEERVMVASNFPLVLLSTSYKSYWKHLLSLEEFSESEKQRIFHDNSYYWYEF